MKLDFADTERRLRKQFGDEYKALTEDQRFLVCNDYIDALAEDLCAVSEYARRIGEGNLRSYAICLQSSGGNKK